MAVQTPIRAVFVDLDGTLLTPQHSISPFTSTVLRQLKAIHGTKVSLIVATGRPFHYVIEQIESCRLQVDYIISSNGARVHNGCTRQPVVAHDIPARTVQQLFRVNVERQNGNTEAGILKTMSTSVFKGRSWFTNFKIAGLGNSYPAHMQPTLLPTHVAESLQALGSAESLRLHDRSEEKVSVADGQGSNPVISEESRAEAQSVIDCFFQDVHMAFFYGPHNNLLPAEAILLDDSFPFTNAVSFSFSLPHIIDIYPKGIDKSYAVKEVLQLLGLSPSTAIAFGDGMNDASMLKAVGKGYVMANALPQLKAALPSCEVIQSNAEDGVAKKLVELFALQPDTSM